MWKQINFSDALRAYLNGQTVKVVYFTENTVLNLQEILQRFEKSAVMFAEDAPQKYNPPDNATEAELVDWIVNGSTLEPATAPEEEPEKAEAEPELESEPDPPPKAVRAKKQLEEAEKNFQKRKIGDIGKLRSLRSAGWPLKKLAEEFGCSEATVYNTMKREGIE